MKLGHSEIYLFILVICPNKNMSNCQFKFCNLQTQEISGQVCFSKHTSSLKQLYVTVHNCSHVYIFFTWHESDTFSPKNLDVLLH